MERELRYNSGSYDITLAKQLFTEYENSIKSVAAGEPMLKQCLFSSLFNIPLSPEYQDLLFRIIMQRSIKIAQVSCDFHCLSNRLQQTLLKNNISAIATIRFADMDRIKDVNENMKRSMGPADIEIATRLRLDIMNSPAAVQPAVKVNLFNLLFKCFIKEPSEERHQSLRSMIQANMAYDKILAVLLTYASLFSHHGNSGYLNASEIKIIEQMQETSIAKLKRYLYASYPPQIASVKLMAVMETLEALKETSEMINGIE